MSDFQGAQNSGRDPGASLRSIKLKDSDVERIMGPTKAYIGYRDIRMHYKGYIDLGPHNAIKMTQGTFKGLHNPGAA